MSAGGSSNGAPDRGCPGGIAPVDFAFRLPGSAMNAQLITELGRILGATDTNPATDKPQPGLPERCYFQGPLSDLGPAPRPAARPSLEMTHLDREAREIAQRGREDLIRFFQMRARYAAT